MDCNKTLNALARNTDYAANVIDRVHAVNPFLKDLFERDGYYEIQGKIEAGNNLSFSEAFGLGAFVCAALNRPLREVLKNRIKKLGAEETETHLLQATTLLAAMSTKEAYVGLTAEEIAGMVAATIYLDTISRVRTLEEVVGFGGMGGDKGYIVDGQKTKLFSLSTLGAITLSADGLVHKHHSYPNTSKVAGQSAIEAYGARSDFHSSEAFKRVFEESNLLMTSCHNTRTLHSLSHRLKGETVNHVIGPLAFTLSADTPIHGFIGVNEKIHPEIIVDAMKILSEKGFQKYANSAVFCGTDLIKGNGAMVRDVAYLRGHVRLDEVAPPPFDTIVSFLVNGLNAGTYILSPDDFYTKDELKDVSLEALAVSNTREAILAANNAALSGTDVIRARYLSMTVGLGLFTKYYLGQPDALDPLIHRIDRNMLQKCTAKAFEIIISGKAELQLSRYVKVTQRYAGGRL